MRESTFNTLHIPVNTLDLIVRHDFAFFHPDFPFLILNRPRKWLQISVDECLFFFTKKQRYRFGNCWIQWCCCDQALGKPPEYRFIIPFSG